MGEFCCFSDDADENKEDDFDLYDDVVSRFEQKKEADQRSYEEVNSLMTSSCSSENCSSGSHR